MRRSLDPILVAAGFAAGQGAEDGAVGGQLIFCIGHDDFSRRHPRLPQAHQQQDLGTCVDLVVDVDAHGTLGRIDLETASLAATLRHVGLDAEADAVSQAVGRPVVEGMPVVHAALCRLFGVMR